MQLKFLLCVLRGTKLSSSLAEYGKLGWFLGAAPYFTLMYFQCLSSVFFVYGTSVGKLLSKSPFGGYKD